VLVQDEIETSRAVEVTWTMHTQAAVEVQGDRVLLSQGGAVLEARLLSPAGATFTVEDVEIAPPQQSAPDLKRLLVRLPEVTSAQIAVLFTPRRSLSSAAPGTAIPGTATAGAVLSSLTPGALGTPTPVATLPPGPAESLPPPELVNLNRWAIADAPGFSDAQT
jgi:hypothetical protein